jgi:hypothetical protein
MRINELASYVIYTYSIYRKHWFRGNQWYNSMHIASRPEYVGKQTHISTPKG